jgi:hypothetical protein
MSPPWRSRNHPARLLEHKPHGFDILRGISPIPCTH